MMPRGESSAAAEACDFSASTIVTREGGSVGVTAAALTVVWPPEDCPLADSSFSVKAWSGEDAPSLSLSAAGGVSTDSGSANWKRSASLGFVPVRALCSGSRLPHPPVGDMRKRVCFEDAGHASLDPAGVASGVSAGSVVATRRRPAMARVTRRFGFPGVTPAGMSFSEFSRAAAVPRGLRVLVVRAVAAVPGLSRRPPVLRPDLAPDAKAALRCMASCVGTDDFNPVLCAGPVRGTAVPPWGCCPPANLAEPVPSVTIDGLHDNETS